MTELKPFGETKSVAATVIELSEQHSTPLVPDAYSVWYRYVVGDHLELKASVDDAIASGGLDVEQILVIHETFLSQRAIESGLTAISNGLSAEVSTVSNQLELGMEGGTRFATHLRDSIRELSVSGTKEEVKAIARQLYKSNQAHLSLTYEMGEQLQRTREQLRTMAGELDSLRKTAFTDHLTQLPNRRYFEQFLDTQIRLAFDNDRKLSLALLDLDHFKRINDSWGHPVGDNILRKLGSLLRDNVKGRDVAARIGGEEFALVLPDTRLKGGAALCDSIREAFSELEWVRQETGERIGTVTLSVGVTQLKADDTPERIFERADRLLYQAKNNGRDRVVAGH